MGIGLSEVEERVVLAAGVGAAIDVRSGDQALDSPTGWDRWSPSRTGEGGSVRRARHRDR